MSASSGVWKAVKAHVPMIRFRKGSVTNSATQGSSNTGSPNNPGPPIGSTPRGSGIDESLISSRYQRKPLTQLEIDSIQMGGSI